MVLSFNHGFKILLKCYFNDLQCAPHCALKRFIFSPDSWLYPSDRNGTTRHFPQCVFSLGLFHLHLTLDCTICTNYATTKRITDFRGDFKADSHKTKTNSKTTSLSNGIFTTSQCIKVYSQRLRL